VTTPTDFLRLALDPVRLGVLGLAVAGPVDLDCAAAQLGVRRDQVVRAAGRLREAGLLDEEMALDPAALREVAAQLPRMEPVAEAIVAEGTWSAEEQQVLARFFAGDRLQSVPSHRGKRLIVLDRIAQEFEPGVRYPEREINFALQVFHPDYAALRRHLVDEEFLTRADGVYWRTGGRVQSSAGQ